MLSAAGAENVAAAAWNNVTCKVALVFTYLRQEHSNEVAKNLDNFVV